VKCIGGRTEDKNGQGRLQGDSPTNKKERVTQGQVKVANGGQGGEGPESVWRKLELAEKSVREELGALGKLCEKRRHCAVSGGRRANAVSDKKTSKKREKREGGQAPGKT